MNQDDDDDDDNVLPPKGQSILGKRKRKENNNYYYSRNNGVQSVEQGAPQNHPQNVNDFMNTEQKDDEMSNSMLDETPQIPRVTSFERGHSLDTKITDEHQETYWTTGTICKVKQDKVKIILFYT